VNDAALVEVIREWTPLAWLVLIVVWRVKARRTKRTVRSESGGRQLLHTAILIAGVLLIFARRIRIPELDRQLFVVTVPIVLAGLIAVVAGVGFSIWARLMLGDNWSNNVTVKEDHTLVRDGPYRLVRHPIYSGILLGMFGAAVQESAIRCFVGVALCLLSFWLKSRGEEGFMVESFGEEYVQYRREVKGLVPFCF
jgi:protein-S-isoprenylcysteine O-methyltransferase Ste14